VLVLYCSQYATNDDCNADAPLEASWYSTSVNVGGQTFDLDDQLFANITNTIFGDHETCTLKPVRGVVNGTDVTFNASAYYTTETTGKSSRGVRSCFAGSETVRLEDGSIVPIAEVGVGDVVLAADRHGGVKFSPVIAVPHARNRDRALFTRIVDASGGDIQVTGDHLILVNANCNEAVGANELLQASDVQVDMCLVRAGMVAPTLAKVTSVQHDVIGFGVYTIVTEEEFVVVSGFVASPFAYNHAVPNAYYNIIRALSTLHPFVGYVMDLSILQRANLLFGDVIAKLLSSVFGSVLN
jgi:hypothetical protein